MRLDSPDERLAAWKYLAFPWESTLLVLGNPSPGLVRGLARFAKQLYIYPTSSDYATQLISMLDGCPLDNIEFLVSRSMTIPLAKAVSLDGVIVIPDKRVDYHVLDLSHHLLARNGAWVVLAPRHYSLRSLRVHRFQSEGRGGVIEYAVLPSLNNPRWYVPLKSRRIFATSLQLHNPTSTFGKAAWRAVATLSRLGLIPGIVLDCIVVAHKLPLYYDSTQSLRGFLREILGRADFVLALASGTPGHYRKATIQAMSCDGDVLAYAKVSDTLQAIELLRQEARLLNRLERLNSLYGKTPRLLGFQERDGTTILVQSSPEPGVREGPTKLEESHVRFLLDVFSLTVDHQSFAESQALARVRRRIEHLERHMSSVWRDRLSKALGISLTTLKPLSLPLGLCHGDFAPWNTCVNRGRLFVFDWEYGHEYGPPFWDLFHFVTQHGILVKKRSGHSLVNALLHPKGTLGNSFAVYANALGLDLKLLPALLTFFLCDVVSFYLEMYDRAGQISPEGHRLLRTWAEMLDILVAHSRE